MLASAVHVLRAIATMQRDFFSHPNLNTSRLPFEIHFFLLLFDLKLSSGMFSEECMKVFMTECEKTLNKNDLFCVSI